MKLQVCLAFASVIALAGPAFGQTCTAFPNPLVNGNAANANDVTADLNYLGNGLCLAPLANPSFTGNVGIGTSSPAFALHAYGTSPNTVIGVQSTAQGAYFGILTPTASSGLFRGLVGGDGTTNRWLVGQYNDGENSLGLFTNNSSGFLTEALHVSSTQFVGIGTTTPSDLLTITNTAANSQIEFNNSASVGTAYLSQSSNSALLSSDAEYVGGNWTARGTSASLIDATSVIAFYVDSGLTSGNTYTPTQRMVINASGDVGIGTTSPSYLLQVGSTSASGIVAEWQNSSGACTLSPASGATLSCSSDERLKKDIVDAGAELPALADMRVRDFTIRATGERMTGVIAQEMLNTHSDMVHRGPDGFYKVDQPNPWKLVKAIQELKADNDRLRAELDRRAVADEEHKRSDTALHAELGDLKRRLVALEERAPAKARHGVHSASHGGPASRIRLTSNGN